LSIYALAAKDYFTKPILKITLLPFIFSILILYALFFVGFDQLLNGFETYQSSLQIHEQHYSDGSVSQSSVELNGFDSIMAYLLQHSITSWLFGAFVLGVGSVITLFLSIITATIIIGFFTPTIARITKQRHYPHFQIASNTTIIDLLFKMLWTLFVMVFLFLLLMPLYFIPLLQVIAINLPFYYFFHKLLTFDVSTTLFKKKEAKLNTLLLGGKLKLTTLLLYATTLIPFVALFATPFYVLVLTHLYIQEAPQQATTNSDVTKV